MLPGKSWGSIFFWWRIAQITGAPSAVVQYGWSNFRRHFCFFYHLGLGRLSVFKLLIFTVVNNLALNNETRSPDLP